MARGVNKTMSASKDKKLRKQQIAEGTDKRTAAQKAEKAKQRKSAITYTLVAIVLVVFFAFIFIYNSSWPSRHMTAVTVDGTDYSVAQANFYYSNSYMNFYNNYATYINYGMFFDPQQSLADQDYGDGTTWRTSSGIPPSRTSPRCRCSATRRRPPASPSAKSSRPSSTSSMSL